MPSLVESYKSLKTFEKHIKHDGEGSKKANE